MIAIAITVIVLGIVVPLAGSDSLLSKLLELWPSYLAYVISFLTIGGFWFNHHTIFFCLRAINPSVMRVNLLLLMAIAFFSFVSTLIQEALINTVRRTFKLPTFTLAFNLATLAYFLGALS